MFSVPPTGAVENVKPCFQYRQLERDLQTVLDEKEELVTERDVYKTKHERLNTELHYILKGDENRVVDIDALIMENKWVLFISVDCITGYVIWDDIL